MSTLAPVSQANRIIVIDILRGIALLGILLMNIPGFSMPDYFSEEFRSNPEDVNFWVRAVINTVFEGKMRALFSAIFGAGIILFTMNKAESGWSTTFLFYRRMAWLVIFGLIHSHIILWAGEILYLYGVVGMLAFLFRKIKPIYLVMAIPLVAIIEFMVGTSFNQEIRNKRLAYLEAAAVQKEDSLKLTEPQRQALKEWRQVEIDFIPNTADAAKHTKIMKSDYASIADYLRKIMWDWQTKYLYIQIGDPLALMLLGIALFKWGFLTGEWSRSQYKRTLLIGYGIGFPLVIFNFYYSFVNFPNHEAFLAHLEKTPVEWMNLIYPVQRILLMLGHAALIILVFQSKWLTRLFERLRAVGQMAFTNYIMHSLICTFFFFGYGLNYYAEFEFYQIFFVMFAIWILQLAYSPIWLKYFLFGPLEWLWRSLTYWKIQPFRRNA